MFKTDSTRIATLDLSFTDMSSAAASRLFASLKGYPSLIHLSLEGNNLQNSVFGSAFVGFVKTQKKLQFLNMAGCNIQEEAGALIGQGLERNNTIRKLVLAQNSIGEKGAIAIANALMNDSLPLASLDLSSNHISEAGGL